MKGYKSFFLPWWLLLSQVAYTLLMVYVFSVDNHDKITTYFVYSASAFSIIVTAILALCAFYQQHAQYNIRSILILTFCIAVLCSVYVCCGLLVMFGLVTVLFLILNVYFMIRFIRNPPTGD
jgi:hypothetical protein